MGFKSSLFCIFISIFGGIVTFDYRNTLILLICFIPYFFLGILFYLDLV